MYNDISSLVITPHVWRVLIAVAVVALRLGLDEVVPRGHLAGRTRWSAAGRR